MPDAPFPPNQPAAPPAEPLGRQIRRAVIWRSGSQIAAQIIQWGATFLVIRILAPADYGLFAMTQLVLLILNLVNGYGLASALIRQPEVSRQEIRQLFGMLILLNGTLAVAQVLLAPLAAVYYRQEIVADLLRVQALLYLATPFCALPAALLSRGMEFAKQAKANIVSAVAGAAAALGGAMMGWGVWALVWAPIVMFAVRGVGLTIAVGGLERPSFDFRGTRALVRYGGLVAVGQLLVFVQFQADVAIAGRLYTPHVLGLYTTSLFLTQIFVSKFIPPLNEVAFSAYARLQGEPGGVANAFLNLVRVVSAAAMPFYLGLAVTAEPLVLTMLGEKWMGAAPIVQVLALGMPAYTIFVLLGPAADALGHPQISTRNAATGALLLPALMLVTVHWGPVALAASWLVAYPILLCVGAWRALPVIGVKPVALIATAGPPFIAAVAMAGVVWLVARMIPPMAAPETLAILVATGAVIYAGWLLLFARDVVGDLWKLARRR